MASHTPPDITAEFELDPGAWYSTYSGYDLAARVRSGDSIRITRGTADQQSNASPTSAIFTVGNSDGLFSDDNPYSPLYGKFGQNTRVRLGVTSSGSWDSYLRTVDYNSNHGQAVYTADKASLDIVGDIDVRLEVTPFYPSGRSMVLAGKYDLSAGSRSWYVAWRSDGTLQFTHSVDGTSLTAVTGTSAALPTSLTGGRIAVRVVLDVNNGAAGRTYTFYTAPSISGPWTQLSQQITAGTTSIFASTARLEVGSTNFASGPVDNHPWAGKIHAFQVYNGIAGTLVADFNPRDKGIGQDVTTWDDTCASPNTWIISGTNLRLGSDRVRACCEISTIPDVWGSTDTDGVATLAAVGPLSRLNSAKASLGSAIYRNYSKYSGLTGYWPMEDASGSTQAASAIAGVGAGTIANCTFGSATGLDGSAGALTLTSAPNISYLRVNTPVNNVTGYSSFLFYFRLDTLPASTFTWITLGQWPGGTTARWTVGIGASTYIFQGYNSVGTLVHATGAISFGTGASPLDQWVGMQITLTQVGGNVKFETAWHRVGTSTFYTHTPGGTTFAGTLGAGFRDAQFDTPDAAFAGAQISQVIMSGTALDLVSYRFRDASIAYAGEAAGRRMQRLADEEDVFFEWLGDLDDTEAVGPQQIATLYANFVSAAQVDGGQLGETRDIFGLRYVSRSYMGGSPAITLDYSQSHLSVAPRPTTDPGYTVNDFTASRPSGSSARYVVDGSDGRRKNVSDPPMGVGRYERSNSFSAATDAQLADLAQWTTFVGTWPERRIPNLSIALHRQQIGNNSTILTGVIALDFGDMVYVDGMENAPRQIPPDDLHLLIFGYTETISNMLWDLVDNTVPAGPYRPLILSNPTGVFPRLDATGNTVLHSDATSGATSLRIRTPATEPAWADTAGYASDFPFDAKLAAGVDYSGERITVTAATAYDNNALPATLDGTFESGVGTWTFTQDCTVTSSTTFAHAGTKSLLMTVTGTPSFAYFTNDQPYEIPVAAGDSISVSAWLRSVVLLSDVRIAITFNTASFGYISTVYSSAASLASGAWTQRTYTGTVPATAAYMFIGVQIFSSPAAGTLLYVDDVTVTDTNWKYQTLTVTRAVNTISRAWSEGTVAMLFEPYYLGM